MGHDIPSLASSMRHIGCSFLSSTVGPKLQGPIVARNILFNAWYYLFSFPIAYPLFPGITSKINYKHVPLSLCSLQTDAETKTQGLLASCN